MIINSGEVPKQFNCKSKHRGVARAVKHLLFLGNTFEKYFFWEIFFWKYFWEIYLMVLSL